MRKFLILVARFGGLLALVIGGAYVSGAKVPLGLHICVGCAVVLALLLLAAIGHQVSPRRAILGAIVGLAAPMMGAMQLDPSVAASSARFVLMGIHLLLGVGAIALAEMLNGAIGRAEAASKPAAE